MSIKEYLSISFTFILILIGTISCRKSTLVGIPIPEDEIEKPEKPDKEDKETSKTESSDEETMTEESPENEETQTETVQNEGIKGSDFEGVYYFKSNGFLELISNSKDQVTILSTNQKLYIENKDKHKDKHKGKISGIGLLPTIYRTGLEVIKSQIFYTTDMTFSSTTHNVRDDKNKVISGVRRVDVLLTYYGPNRLYIQYTIYKTRLSEKAGTKIVVVKSLSSI